MNRRDLLKGIAASSLLGLGGSSLQTAGEGLKVEEKKTKLSLVFHGPFACVVYPDRIVMLTPRVAEHRYRVGELLLREGKYALQNVSGAKRMLPIDRRRNAVLSARDFGISAIDPLGQRYCSIELPFPEEIIAVRSLTSPIIFSGSLAKQLNEQVRQVPDIIAFKYTQTFDQPPLLDNMPELNLGTHVRRDVDVHFFAEPKQVLGEEHTIAAFRKLVELFPGLHLGLNRNFVLHARIVKEGSSADPYQPINVSPANCPAPGFFVNDLP